MEELTTAKTCRMYEDGYAIHEFETLAYKQYLASVAATHDTGTHDAGAVIEEIESEERPVQFRSGSPKRRVIEPLRTWLLGRIEGAPFDIMDFLCEWLQGRRSPLSPTEVSELRSEIAAKFA